MKFLAAMTMILASAGAWAADHSVGITPGGLNLYSITEKGVTSVGSPFVTPVLDQNPLTPVIAVMNTRHDFVFVLYEHLNSSDGTAYVVGLKVTNVGLQQRWVFSHVLNMSPEANPLVRLTAGPNYAIVIWTNDFSSPYTGWIINEFGHLVATHLSQFNGNEQISLHVAPNEKLYYFCHVEGFPGTQTAKVSAYDLDNDPFSGGTQPHELLFDSTDGVFIASVCN